MNEAYVAENAFVLVRVVESLHCGVALIALQPFVAFVPSVNLSKDNLTRPPSPASHSPPAGT